LREMIVHYRNVKELAWRAEALLLRILVEAGNMNKPADGMKVMALVRDTAAQMRGLRAP